MPPKLAKATSCQRVTVSQEARRVLEPADHGGDRRVTLTGIDGELFVGFDVEIQEGFDNDVERVRRVIDASPDAATVLEAATQEARKIGPNRDYTLPLFPVDTSVTFLLQPQQWVVAKVKSGLGHLTMIVEYLAQ